MIAILDVTVLITAVSVSCITVITMAHGCYAVTTDIVAVWGCSVQEESLVTDTAFIAQDSNVVEGGVAGGAGEGIVELNGLKAS